MDGRLNIVEYYLTIQGENFVGSPVVLLRLAGCPLIKCKWCDTDIAVRKRVSPFELLNEWEEKGIINNLNGCNAYHLILTGGSPLLQQRELTSLMEAFQDRYQFKPFVELENECIIYPEIGILKYVNIWNNSPKLSNSGIEKEKRYFPAVIKRMALMENSWFKFVIKNPQKDWKEIENDFLSPSLITKKQIVLMPEGTDSNSLRKKGRKLVELCLEKGVKYSPRLHIDLKLK